MSDRRLSGSTDARLKAAADALSKSLSAVEGEIYQVRNQSGQDPLNFPIKVNNRLASLLERGESRGRPADRKHGRDLCRPGAGTARRRPTGSSRSSRPSWPRSTRRRHASGSSRQDAMFSDDEPGNGRTGDASTPIARPRPASMKGDRMSRPIVLSPSSSLSRPRRRRVVECSPGRRPCRRSARAARRTRPWKIWYTHPADKWENALPVGNGRLGAMVFGKTDEEEIQLNEDTYWSGGPVLDDGEGRVHGAAGDPAADLRRRADPRASAVRPAPDGLPGRAAEVPVARQRSC